MAKSRLIRDVQEAYIFPVLSERLPGFKDEHPGAFDVSEARSYCTECKTAEEHKAIHDGT